MIPLSESQRKGYNPASYREEKGSIRENRLNTRPPQPHNRLLCGHGKGPVGHGALIEACNLDGDGVVYHCHEELIRIERGAKFRQGGGINSNAPTNPVCQEHSDRIPRLSTCQVILGVILGLRRGERHQGSSRCSRCLIHIAHNLILASREPEW